MNLFGRTWKKDSLADTPKKVDVIEWELAHVDEIRAERQVRAALRASVLGILGIDEQHLPDGFTAVRNINSSDVRDREGKLFPNIGISATTSTVDVVLWNRQDPRLSPQGWSLMPDNSYRRGIIDFEANCMDIVLGSQLRDRQFTLTNLGKLSAADAHDRLGTYMELMTTRSDVYNFAESTTQLIAPNQ